MSTARFEWSLRETATGGGKTAHTRFFSSRCAGDDYLIVDRGDEDAIVQRTSDGREAAVTYKGARHALMKGGEAWIHVEDAIDATVVTPRDAEMFGLYDMRRLGIHMFGENKSIEERAADAGYPAPRYESSTTADGLEVVTATVGSGKQQWWIDPEKGWNVVRTAVWLNGAKIGEARYELGLYDGVWFPKRMEKFRLAAGEAEPSTVLEVLSAEFNRLEHPQELTPATIGIEVGTSLMLLNRVPPVARRWDGEKLVRFDEFRARLENGEIALGPTVARETRRLQASGIKRQNQIETDPKRPNTRVDPTNGASRFQSEWEAYTRRFIARYRLDPGQTQKALEILRDCQDRGNQYLTRRKPEFQQLEKLELELKSAPPEDERIAMEKRQRLRTKRELLRAPIGQIFETQLKPRLSKIPTRAQRQTAEGRAPGKKGSGKGG